MATGPTVVIVGAGLAGAKAAEALRTEGFEGRVVLLGDEAHDPYLRPPLSKDYLQGKAGLDTVWVNPAPWYAEHDVELRAGTRVTALRPAAHEVVLDGGETLRYDAALLTTGASPRSLPVPGADPRHVATLRRLEDCERLREAWGSITRLAVVGGGWIGLEVAAAARGRDIEVTVVEQADLPLLGVLGPETAAVFADLHREHGVDLRLGAQVREILAEDGAAAVRVVLGDGGQVEADLVVAGVGARPNTELAEAAGLAVDDGVVVDEHLRTSDPDVYAAGDVARAYHPLLRRHLRVEHWANALNQPAVAARSILGQDAVYDRLPYFYTDQYDLGMEYTGQVPEDGYDEVVLRGDVPGREFVAFWLQGRRVVAGMAVNTWDVIDDVGALVRSGAEVDRARLADVSVPIADLGATPG